MKSRISFSILIFFIITQFVYADKWQTVGARAMGMGGTGVAVATGFAQQYYNPALLATQEDNATTIQQYNNNVSLDFNMEIETTEQVLTSIDMLSKTTNNFKNISNAINNNGNINSEDFDSVFKTLSVLKELNKKNSGATVDANVGITTKLKKLSVSVRSYMYSGITPIIDTRNISLMSDPSNPSGSKKITGLKYTTNITDESYKKYVERLIALFNKYGLTQEHIYKYTGYNQTPEQLANAIIKMVMGEGTTKVEEMTKIIEKELPNEMDIISQDNTGNYADNESQAIVDAGVFTEVAIGYGHEIYNGIQVGGNLKFIEGQMAETGIMILSDNDKIEDTLTDALKQRKSSNQIAVDLGLLFNISKFMEKDILFNPIVGITARNINSPSFKRPSKPSNSKYSKLNWNSSNYDLDRQIGAGAAISPIENLTVALDIDILKNKTMSDDFNSQDLGFGLEYILFNKKSFSLPLRAGLSKNVSNSKTALEYTAGLGIYTFGFCLEFAGGISGTTTTIDGNEIPATASFALNLGYSF